MKQTEKNISITKGMKTKKKIYDVSIQLFEEHGIDQISVNDIIQKSGISKGAFYVHYDSKYELIKEYVHTLDLNYEEYFESIPKSTSSFSMIDLVTRKTVHVLVNDIGYKLLKNIYEAMLSEKINSDDILNYSRSLPGIYKKIILNGIGKGEFNSSIDADFIAEQLIISIRGMAFEWCIYSSSFDFEKKLLEHIKLLLEGIRLSN